MNRTSSAFASRLLAAGAVVAVAVGGPALAGGPAQARHAPATNHEDRTFVSDSTEGDLFEVAGGRLAMQRSHDPAVRRFGHRMVVDHRRIYRATRAVARDVGLEVATEPSRGQQAVLRSWRHVSGHAFVCSYVPYEWEDHQLDISDSQEEVEEGRSPAVVADAQDGLPVLHNHLDLASHLLHGRGC